MRNRCSYAGLVSAYFSVYLAGTKNVSTNTIYSYRDTFVIFHGYLEKYCGFKLEKMLFNDLSRELILEFLQYLETERKYSISSRNQRLAALKSFAKYVQIECPDEMILCQRILSISKNLRWGIRKRMESGTYHTSSVPYGYKQVNYDLVPAPNQIEIVKDIFNAFLQGESTTKIADDLNRLRPDADKHWHHTTIERILKNEKYAGCSLYQKSYTSDDLPFKRTENNGEVLSYYAPDTHNGIISQADFDKVQALLQRKSVGPCPRKDTAFSKMLYCAECGSMLSRKINRSTQATWLCRTHLRCAADCPTPPIQEELIQRAFLTMHNKLIVNYTQIFAPALHDLYAAQKILDDKESQRQELNQQVHLLAKKLHNLSRLREKNCITAAQYWERRNPLERELTDVKNTISKAATNHPLLRTLAQTKQLAEHYTYLKPLTEFDEYEFKFAVNRVLVDSESCTFELKNGMKFKEIF